MDRIEGFFNDAIDDHVARREQRDSEAERVGTWLGKPGAVPFCLCSDPFCPQLTPTSQPPLLKALFRLLCKRVATN
jgi:hypothetical protein